MTRAPSFVRGGVAVALFTALSFTLPNQAIAADDGLGGLFQRLFQPSQPVAMQPAPAADAAAWPTQRQMNVRRAARALNTRPRPNMRYAALPKAEPLKIRVSDRQTPLDLSAGPAAAFMKDETLRPGDIVVLKEGVKVFTGNPDKRHAARDFEGVGRSAFVDRHTRALLSAMVMPVGAIPADEARRMAAKARKVLPTSVAPVQAETASMRVIMPWTVAASN
ncbi:MAG: hypothetical protein Q7T93_12410 [Methylobacterium sp.]|uniref:hypothetical protein n=1 Tax=unclassified Methylobacterium TaxID=2615210 RepID=UPI000ADAA6B2|nr:MULTISPECIES: hypothetical protein [unclassified Methylobacterium]MDO9427621.1 hypothetical protein [Methylobacterium sp.]TXM69394.1 hypothetical protein FV218_17235 [Methylobacterium sp. WL69]